jgi:lipopolysaccharide assembly protein A
MRFLKTLFWILIAAAIGLFSVRNWTPVTINLWGGLVMDTVLPVVAVVAFLIGLLPALVLHRATRWSMRRKLDSAERSISELRAPVLTPPLSEPASITPVMS